ncbi:MAG: acetolactate synthase [Planctomycetes bacterium]|nr:acetolactate synthase [Planctomycetota bacterium]
METRPFETAEDSDFPSCQQLSVFVENRLGQLLRLTRVLNEDRIRILALSVDGSIDCAVARLLVNDPDAGYNMITEAGFAVSQCEVIVVELPPGKRGILSVCTALIVGEVNINYVYPLLAGKSLGPSLVIQVDNLPTAVSVLQSKQFRVLDQSDL